MKTVVFTPELCQEIYNNADSHAQHAFQLVYDDMKDPTKSTTLKNKKFVICFGDCYTGCRSHTIPNGAYSGGSIMLVHFRSNITKDCKKRNCQPEICLFKHEHYNYKPITFTTDCDAVSKLIIDN